MLAGDPHAATGAAAHQRILRRYRSPGLGNRAREVSDDFQIVVERIVPVTADDVARSRDLSARYPTRPAGDLVRVAVTLNHGIHATASADRRFDLVAEIVRPDPLDLVS